MMKRLFMLGLMAALLAFTALALPAINTSTAHAAAAASCTDDGCDGANPNHTGCASGAYVAKSVNFTAHGGGVVELVFNTSCHAGWGFIKFNNAMASGHTADAQIYRTTDGSAQYCYSSGGNGDVTSGQHSCYSAMLGDASNEQAIACGYYDGTQIACTDLF